MAMPVFAATQYRVDGESVRPLKAPLAIGAKVKFDRVPIDGKMETLDLKRFEVFAKDAEINIYGANGELLNRVPPPAVRYYRGRIAGEADSIAFVSLGADDRLEGVVFKGDRRFGIGSRARTHKQITREGPGFDFFVQESEPIDDIPMTGQGFVCDIEGKGISAKPTLANVVHGVTGQPRSEAALATGTARWVINMAIETDYELYVNAGSNATNVNTYVGNLIGAMSTIYERDLSAEVVVSFLGIQTSSSDPFTVVPGAAGTWNAVAKNCTHPFTPPNDCMSSFHALMEFGDRWANTPPSAAARSTTALLSGKSQLAGVAWTDVLCQNNFLCSGGNCGDSEANGHYGGRYSYNGGIDPPANNSVPDPNANAPTYTVPSSNYWPLLELAHETGHNVFSNHTHCKVLSAEDQVTYGRTYVDYCYNGECYAGSQLVPAEKGTIMSYCHNVGPGYGTNSRFTFGKAGEASYVMPIELKAAIQAVTPSLSAITAPASLAPGAAGAASVTNVGGLTYAWTVTNGVLNSGQGTAAINFTATTDPVTVEVKVTNAAGCSTTDFKTVAVTAPIASNVRYDFNGDGKADILWRETASGATIEWLMNGGAISSAPSVHSGGNTGWTVAGIDDFDGDGRNDLLWRNNASGATYLWTMNGGTITSSTQVHAGGNTGWTIATVGDFTGDEKADLMFRNNTTGQLYLWIMNGAAITSSTSVHPGGNTGWSIIGSADFNADNRNDILWRDNTSGATLLWTMNGATISSTASVHPGGNTGWTIPGLGDLNGDGRADILWHETASGASVIWQMNGAVISSSAVLHAGGNLGWNIASIANFDGDADVDVLWRNNSTGQSILWILGPSGIGSTVNVHPGSNTGWNVITSK